MLFSSPAFFIFFTLYLLIHYFTPQRYRLGLIILGSSLFYAYWNPWYLWVPYTLTFATHFGVHWMDAARNANDKKTRLAILVCLLLLPLGFFKYTNFFYSLVQGVFGGNGMKVIELSLPLGISFVSFTLIAYVIDVYRGRFPAEKQILRLLASIFFFPHLIAGPIVRPSQLIPQLRRANDPKKARFTYGVALFSLGLFKKLVLADPMAAVVDRIYNNLSTSNLADHWLAFYGFALQIYCDFSGYTDMALGLAVLLHIRLPNNFSRPYTATSIPEFWRLWHITLSTWLRDYLYIPLGGSRVGTWKQARNLLLTMILGGLWHGANMTFVVWGFLHGLAISVIHLLRKMGSNVSPPRWLGIFCTFHFVTIAWVFFRAPTVSIAVQMLTGLFGAVPFSFAEWGAQNAFVLVLLLFFALTHRFDKHAWIRLSVIKFSKSALWGVIVTAWILAVTISAGSSAQFIYFEF